LLLIWNCVDPLQQRWASAACPLPHAAPAFESFASIHAASFSSVASPEVSGKSGAPGTTSTEDTVASSEEKDEPIQPPYTGDDKGGTGQCRSGPLFICLIIYFVMNRVIFISFGLFIGS